MSLENWVQNAWLRRQATSPTEIQQLLKIVDRDLRDSNAKGISADSRFAIAFNSALQSATVALRASGYRTAGQGHHVRVIDSLPLTIGADSQLVQKLQALGRKRNTCFYDMAGAVSDTELREMTAVAISLRDRVLEWLRKHHSELLK